MDEIGQTGRLLEELLKKSADIQPNDWVKLNQCLTEVSQRLGNAVDEVLLIELSQQIISVFETTPALVAFKQITLRRLTTLPKSSPPPSQISLERLKNKMLKASDLAHQQVQESSQVETNAGDKHEIQS